MIMKDVNLLINNGVNVEKSLELFGDIETYNITLVDFINSADKKLEQIKEYKEKHDMKNYAILVHSLKSDAKYFGFEKLAEIAYQHELKSKDNNYLFVFENYDTLMKEADRIIQLVNRYLGLSYSELEEVELALENKEDAILIIDDSNLIRSYITKIFKNNIKILTAKDGKEAIDIIENNKTDNIRGALLDLYMPNCDGFQVLEYFKKHNLFNQIPVSVITGEEEKEPIKKAFTYPIVDMIIKPFSEENIKLIVEKTINYINMV